MERPAILAEDLVKHYGDVHALDGVSLQVPAGTPLLSVERIAYTYNDVPMELRRGLYLTGSRHYRNDLS